VRTLALFSYRKRWLVLATWLVSLVIMGGAVATIGVGYNDEFSLPDTESTSAFDLLKEVSPASSGDQITVVARAETGTMNDAGPKQRFTETIDKLRANTKLVASVSSPYEESGQISEDDGGKIAFATVTLNGTIPNDLDSDDAQEVVKLAEEGRGDGLQVEVTGNAAAEQEQGGTSELIGLAAAAVVLFIVFGTFLAMVLPLITAIVSIGLSIAFVGVVANIFTVATFAPTLSALLGLGVGVDYALFIVTRYRQGLLDGLDPEEAVAEAIDTSGRAVLFAGTVVCIAILGLFALGLSFFYGVALAAALSVATTVLASLTLLPALLGFFGRKVLRKKLREHTAGTAHETAGWQRWAHTLEKRPALFAGVAGLVMIVLILPLFGIRLGLTDQGSDPSDSTTRKGYDLLADGFGPGFNGPFLIVTELGDDPSAGPTDKLVAALKADPAVQSVSDPAYAGGANAGEPSAGGVAITTVYPKSAPQDKETSDLVKHIRDDISPAAEAGSSQQIYVGGATATFEDFNTVITGKLPLFIGVVVLLSFILLTAVFRSLVVSLVAAVMNLVSAGAAFGVVVAVFQWGWGLELLGIDRSGPIISFLPVMLFAILFGLSMDYEVFLLSRIHEEWIKRQDNREAVIHGLAATGRTISAAAAIMVVLFLAFVLGPSIIIKTFGLGLAIAVLLDAIVVRCILVPAIMLILGKSNWYLPKWLDKALPNLSVEGQPHAHVEPEPEPVRS
jgi:RND superfamily putative drug exporter